MLATLAALTEQTLEKGQAQDSKNMLPAITGKTDKQLRNEVLLAAQRKTHLAIRKDNWIYIGAQGGGGFTSGKQGTHGFGGPAAITFAGEINSDIENGKIREDAPPAQLYNLETDVEQTTNLYNQYPEVVKEMKAILETYILKEER
jgi:hypothetical protein